MTTIRGTEHPYYGAEGVYQEHASWADFLTDGPADADLDLNLLYRWDWEVPAEHEDDGDGVDEHLDLFWVMPRKDRLMSHRVFLTYQDEDAVRAWLFVRARHLVTLWEPMLDDPYDDPADRG